jgi:dihydroflavonol-4-reductase
VNAVFLTGGTGLIGSNIIEQLCGAGTAVRALVRPGSDASAIEALGAEIVRGDITDAKEVLAAAEGCEAAIHSAAVLGGPQQDIREHEAVNIGGAINVFEAAATIGMRRVTALNTTTFFDMRSGPLTERSAVLDDPSPDPYTLTKKEAFLESMRRAGEGADINVVISGGAYGPAPQVNRSMEPPSFNLRIVWALRKEVDDYIGFPVPWVYTADVARCAVLALERGVAGETYLAFGRPEDVGSMAMFMDRSCRVAGVDHHVHEVTGAELDTPEALARFGPTLLALGKQPFPKPFFENRQTVERLGYDPIALDEGLATTIAWLREHDLL